MIRFQGAVSTSGGLNSQFLLLPPTMRPATAVYMPVDLCNATKGRIVVQPDGTVSVESATTFDQATCFTSLESAAFGL